MFINDFSKRLKSEKPIIDLDMLDSFHPCISRDENRELIKELTEEEIIITLLHINGLEAHGLHGLQAIFYHKHWKIVNRSIYRIVKAFFYNGHLLKEVNKTLITLIPKLENPKA